MKITRAISFIIISLSLSGIAFAIDRADDLNGTWPGILGLKDMKINLVFKIETDAQGKFTATLDVIDQGVTGIQASVVTFNDLELFMNFNALGSSFQGKLSEDGSTLEGEWQLQGKAFPLKLVKTEKEVKKKRRPQDPVEPYDYISEEVTYQNLKADITLAGTLTMPKSGGPFTTILLITGSGQQNRDGEVFNHRPFLILADFLTSHGFAILRVDDRGIGGSTGKFSDATTLDFAGDVRAGVKFLKSRKEINLHRIGLLGHSEGGLIAPIVASNSDDIAFIVLLAGPGVTGAEQLYLQNTNIARFDGKEERSIELSNKLSELVFNIIKEEKNNNTAEKKILVTASKYINGLNEEEKNLLGVKPEDMLPQVKRMLSPWMRFYLFYDPVMALRKVKCPILALNGSEDLIVAPKENLSSIEKALNKSITEKYTIKEFEGLNHGFQTAVTGSVQEYGTTEETLSPKFMQYLLEWINALSI
jgi:pimeloyl-ACP methyl ester carboxylesterase